MTDLTDLLDSAAGRPAAPTPDVVAADLRRGRRALARRAGRAAGAGLPSRRRGGRRRRRRARVSAASRRTQVVRPARRSSRRPANPGVDLVAARRGRAQADLPRPRSRTAGRRGDEYALRHRRRRASHRRRTTSGASCVVIGLARPAAAHGATSIDGRRSAPARVWVDSVDRILQVWVTPQTTALRSRAGTDGARLGRRHARPVRGGVTVVPRTPAGGPAASIASAWVSDGPDTGQVEQRRRRGRDARGADLGRPDRPAGAVLAPARRRDVGRLPHRAGADPDRAGLRLVSPDGPGFGGSPALAPEEYAVPRLAGLVWGLAAELGLDRPVLMGHSWGGVVILAAAAERPPTSPPWSCSTAVSSTTSTGRARIPSGRSRNGPTAIAATQPAYADRADLLRQVQDDLRRPMTEAYAAGLSPAMREAPPAR